MFNLEGLVDVSLIWFVLIATAVFIYVLLDGFDLGVGILFLLRHLINVATA